MLFKNFTYCILTCAILVLLNMCAYQEWEYIILPIGVIIGSLYKIFDDDDREYLMSQGIDPDNYEGWFPDLFPYHDNINNNYQQGAHRTYYNPSNNSNTHIHYTQNTNAYNEEKKIYKSIVKKCKRNFKINIEE